MRQNKKAKPMHFHAFDAAEALTRAQLSGFREAVRNCNGTPMRLRAVETASDMTKARTRANRSLS